ncbi:MlaE family ABC transporter permease [candidate division KSB1 bacterium]
MLYSSLKNLRYIYKDRVIIASQMLEFGIKSFPIVAIIGIFTGAVSAWQAEYQFRGLIPIKYVAPATAKAIFIELGPVLTALIIAGRNGASIAAELGTMKVTEQIDALETLAIDPVRFLSTPRIIAGFTMMPALVIFADFIAIMGAFIVLNVFLSIDYMTFINGVKEYFRIWEFLGGVIKAFVFGGTTALVGVYIGFSTHGGAEGVGRATIRAFVISSVLILINDYLLATIMF